MIAETLILAAKKINADGGTFWLPESASTTTAHVDPVFNLILWICSIFFVMMVGTMVYFVIRYRRRPGVKTSPISGNSKLEFWWSFIPGLILLGFFVLGFKNYMAMHVPPADAMEVRVIAKKWSWQFEYPTHNIKKGHLVVPVNKPVKLTMYSEDVLHSFFVPAFRIKRDVIPERYTVLWFQATKTGQFDVRCAEYCGTQHSLMSSRIKVVTQAEFDKWIREGGGAAGLTAVDFGKMLFNQTYKCNICHDVSPEKRRIVGPPLWGIYGKMETLEDGRTVKVDDNYIKRSILNPQADIVKGYPRAGMNAFESMSLREITAIVDYMKSLTDKKPESGKTKK